MTDTQMEMERRIHHPRLSSVLTALGAVWAAVAAVLFLSAHRMEPLVVGEGVTSIRRLSEWHTPLAGTPGDTDVYVLDSGVEGAKVLITFGTHPNEVASHVAGTLMVENAVCREGMLMVIVHTNASGFTHGDPQEAYPTRFEIERPDGTRRWFRFGSRYTNPVHQWPDPTLHINPAGQVLAGIDSRNLNRCYPGRPHGFLTEQVAWAVCELIRQEDVDLFIDIHEAAPEYPTVNVMIAHERAMELASEALIDLEMGIPGFEINLEPSPLNLRGLTHREVGDSTDAMAVLMETANPSQGRLKGRTTEEQVVEGRDSAYTQAYQHQIEIQARGTGDEASRRILWALPYDSASGTYPLRFRVARHLAGIESLLNALTYHTDRGIAVEGIPDHGDLITQGIGAFLAPPPED
ncbi:succinylglutamate desuccinylase/aspartoacylase family protein [Candidatus Sumerlaeota bacterium]|nr:succinylglutamate desuccinylase/aspartoacylase family protein [Candidatus Sumerlaeota bacterium]